ncbi:MAG TPA: type 1 glutamine amidotransferase domain-containing protein [Gammaproteobacteria bacterium]|nr:type 1 glutamine amidotransferase domain-containing protein [Gammaproteobacteria bacterium]
MNNRKQVLMVLTSHDRIDDEHPTGLWFEEFAVPYQRFRGHGYGVAVASIRGGAVPIDPRSMPEDPDAPGTRLSLDALDKTLALPGVELDAFDAVFFPGGHGTMYDLPGDPAVARLISTFAEQDKVVAAVCHGPAAFVAATRSDGAPFLTGRRVAAFTNAEERAVELDALMPFLLESRLRELGAEVETGPDWSDHVVVDGRLVTGQNPQSSASAAEAVIELLGR